jgi:hypothetical protein
MPGSRSNTKNRVSLKTSELTIVNDIAVVMWSLRTPRFYKYFQTFANFIPPFISISNPSRVPYHVGFPCSQSERGWFPGASKLCNGIVDAGMASLSLSCITASDVTYPFFYPPPPIQSKDLLSRNSALWMMKTKSKSWLPKMKLD